MKLRAWGACFLFLGLAPLAQAAAIAEVAAVRGEASTGGQPLAMGQRLEAGAELRTGADGRVRLRFDDGSTLVLGDHTVMKIERFEMAPDQKHRQAATIALTAGLIGQKVAPSEQGYWEVRTPTAVTAVRGTEFMVEVGADQATAVNVKSGQVEVEALQGPVIEGMRSLHPRGRVTLGKPAAGTQCTTTSGCSSAATWSAERVQSAEARLSLD